MLSSAQQQHVVEAIHQYILDFTHSHGRAPTQKQISNGTGYSRYWVLRASARLQGQQRVHLNSSRPVLRLE